MSSELQTMEDLGLCKYGESGKFPEEGHPFLSNLDYGLDLPQKGTMPVNPSGGLLVCGHPVGATGIMQVVFAFWQLQGSLPRHFQLAGKSENDAKKLQLKDPKRGLIHSHAGTGKYVTVSILERQKEVQMETY